MRRIAGTVAAALTLTGVAMTTTAPTASAAVQCQQFSEHAYSDVTIIDTIDNIGPIPLIYPIVTRISTNVIYDYCYGWHHGTYHRYWVPTAIQINFAPAVARGDAYRCGAWDWMRARFYFWDGEGRNINPSPVTAKCHSGWSGGYQFREINADRTRLHYTQSSGVPKAKAAIYVNQNYWPDEHTTHHFRLDPWNVFNKRVTS